MTGLTCLTDLNGVVLDVADLTDGSAAVHTDVTDFAGGQTNLSHLAFLSHKLSLGSRGADELSAASGIKLDVVDKRTDRDVCDRKGVTGFDICIGTGVEYISVGYAERSDDVALLAFVVLKKCDVSGAVRIVLDSDNRSLLIDIALEVDDTVLLLVSAAAMTNGDAAVAVSSGILLLDYNKASFGGELGDLIKGGTVMPRRPGVVGLYLIVGIYPHLLS